LLVNTASRCGLAPQFAELEALHKKFQYKGLTVIGFPCNQFANQEPETNETLENYCLLNFGVTFPLSELIEVNGKNTHPIFKYLKDHASSPLLGKTIKWNFTKFLVEPHEKSITRFTPQTSPNELEKIIAQFTLAQ
jgi:glutathione peroxidase